MWAAEKTGEVSEKTKGGKETAPSHTTNQTQKVKSKPAARHRNSLVPSLVQAVKTGATTVGGVRRVVGRRSLRSARRCAFLARGDRAPRGDHIVGPACVHAVCTAVPITCARRPSISVPSTHVALCVSITRPTCRPSRPALRLWGTPSWRASRRRAG